MTQPYDMYSCVALNRSCGKPSLPGEYMVCQDHLSGAPWPIRAPGRIFYDPWLNPDSLYGPIILDDIRREGVHEAHRTLKRQAQLDAKYREEERCGIQLFGETGLRPNIRIKRAFLEAERFGYRILEPPHILDCDEIHAANDKENRVGQRVVRVVHEFAPDCPSLRLPESVWTLMDVPWALAWVWINIIRDGVQIHCVELVGPQIELKQPNWDLTLAGTAWWPRSYEIPAAA